MLPEMCDRITNLLKMDKVGVPSHVVVLVSPGLDFRTALEINSEFGSDSVNGRWSCEVE